MNSRMGLPVPQTSMLAALRHFGLDPLADQRRDDVRPFGVIRVAGTVQVREDQMDRIQPILFLVGFTLHGQHFLGQAVVDHAGVAGAGPEVFFLQVAFEIAGVAACGADVNDLGRPASRAASIKLAPMTRLV